MNSNLSKYSDYEGKIISLSHTFRLVASPLFIMELETITAKHFVIVRRNKHLAWHKDISPGSFYNITNLKSDRIYKGKYDIDILTTSHLSNISLIRKEDHKFSESEVIEGEELLCYRGIVTTIIDGEVGIYKLGDVVLITSFLMDITTELFSSSAIGGTGGASPPKKVIKVKEAKVIEGKEASLSASSISVGDELSIYNAHCIKGRDGILSLVCCGKSLIRTKRCAPSNHNKDNLSSNSGILHCLHTFNFGLSFLYWLWDLQNLFLNNLFNDECQVKICSRKWEKEKGLLWKYVEEQLKDYKREPRSLPLEFLLSNHSCVVQQTFDGLTTSNISQLLHSENLHLREETTHDVNSIWTYSSIEQNMHRWVIFGTLGISAAGTLQIEEKGDCMDLVIVGTMGNLYSKIGDVIAVFNFDYVEEKFDLFEGKFNRKYLVVRSKDVISISSTFKSKIIKNEKQLLALNHYELKISAISGLNFFTNDIKRDKINGFFIANATIHHKDLNGKMDTWSNNIRFKGKMACNLHPFIREPCIVYGKTRTKHVDCSFRKTCYFSLLKQFDKQFKSVECSEAPLDFEVDTVVNLNSKATDAIMNILQGKDLSSFFNIEGKIIQKWFMTPKFCSQLVEVPIQLLKKGIGVPGSKVIRLLIQDKDNPGFSIWVYLSSGGLHLPQYTLGLIPGTEVNITWLERSVSQKGLVYLSRTSFTTITILNFENLHNTKPVAKHQFITELAAMPSGSVGLIFATVSLILKVCLKMTCSNCNSDIENGSCSFSGCHASGSHTVTGFAKIMVDDGTNSASMFVKDITMIRTLYRINDAQWFGLNEILRRSPLNFKFQNYKSKIYENQDEKTFAELITNSQVFRPLKIMCRIFPVQENLLYSNCLELFAIDLTDINPVLDIALLKTKR